MPQCLKTARIRSCPQDQKTYGHKTRRPPYYETKTKKPIKDNRTKTSIETSKNRQNKTTRLHNDVRDYNTKTRRQQDRSFSAFIEARRSIFVLKWRQTPNQSINQSIIFGVHARDCQHPVEKQKADEHVSLFAEPKIARLRRSGIRQTAANVSRQHCLW